MEIWGIDTKAVSEAIGLAKDGFGLVKEAGGVAGKLRDVFRANQDSATPPEVLALASSLGEKLVQAQLAQSEIMNRLLELEAALREAQRKNEEADRYELIQLPKGSFVLALKEGDARGEPHHHLCHACMQNGKKSILHEFKSNDGRHSLECRVCAQFYFIEIPNRQAVQMSGRVIR